MTPAESKPWTLLAYLVADDQEKLLGALDSAAKKEIRAICEGADLERMHVALQVDLNRTAGVFRARVGQHKAFEKTNPTNYPVWGAVLEELKQSQLLLLREKEDLNAATVGVLKAFLEWGARVCPATRRVIFFYGHAFGPMGLFYDRASGTRVSNTLRLTELAEALQSSHGPAELILFRDCFMGTLETAYQLQGVARFMVATQAEAPIAGTWQWQALIDKLQGDVDSATVAGMVAAALGEYHDKPEHRGPFAQVPWSLIDIGAVHQLTEPLSALVKELVHARGDAAQRDACSLALEGARRGRPGSHENPGDPALLDLQTMCDNLQRCGNGAIASAAQEVGEIARTQVVKWHHPQNSVFTGLSIYYKPVKKTDADGSFIYGEAETTADQASYEALALSKETGWHQIAFEPFGADVSGTLPN